MMDEYRNDFEEIAVKCDLSTETIETGEYLSTKTQEAYEWFLIGRNARTEAKVSGEVCQYCGDHESVHVSPGRGHSFVPAPQSPVVPGVEELRQVRFKAAKEWLEGPIDRKYRISQADFETEAIHSHLLANARESREGVLRHALDEMAALFKHICGIQGWEAESFQEFTLATKALATVGKEG